jgi:hypothetical protein
MKKALRQVLPALAISVLEGISFFNLALYTFLALLYYTSFPEATKNPRCISEARGPSALEEELTLSILLNLPFP